MSETIVDTLHSDFTTLLSYLNDNNEISFQSLVNDNFRKSLLLSSASYFENVLSECVYRFVVECTYERHIITFMVRRNVIERKYHTWFEWGKSNNANSFFSIFGEDFLSHAKIYVRGNEEIATAIKAFLDIGTDRNRLVHQNFASFTLEKTAEEIYQNFLLAKQFVDWFPVFLKDFNDSQPS
ncbi:HEPN domain-containing protein [Pantoea ananatis]|uniref:HEPN domain-containing protein n=1 Tax=Pantoea ananas TaxID=553 RepID=UPI000E26FBA0|nr:HEPN domain-containing protein [Pantoea ananatis]REE67527.1 hypothetical protein C7424_3952 [Pantoea ananatis]